MHMPLNAVKSYVNLIFKCITISQLENVTENEISVLICLFFGARSH